LKQIFENYAVEFYSLQQTLEKAISLSSSSSINDDDHIGGVAQTPASTETNNESEIEDSLAEMEQLVRRMDLEARSVGGNDAKQMKILRDCKAKAQELKAKAREAKERRAQTDSRAQLFASSSGGGGGGTGPAMLSSSNSGGEQDRRREQNSALDSMMKNTARIEQTGERIRESKGRLIETEDLGAAILQDLHRQRETIVESRESLRGADDTLSASRKILQTMSRRAQQNKLLFYGVVTVLVITILTVAYKKLNG
jgi:vesicle transport through interaction with t-SNAREs 1